MEEVWKDIVDYEGLYQISNFGRIKSMKREVCNNYLLSGKQKRNEMIRASFNKKGYRRISLCKNGKAKNFMVHRLVACAFVENPNNLTSINHKDENKSNNNAYNLEWCSVSYNINYGSRNKKVTDKLSKAVIQITMDGNKVKEWDTIRDVERELGFNASSIIKCCKMREKYYSAYGYKWKYKPLTYMQ